MFTVDVLMTATAAVDAATLTISEKISAVKTETEVKQAALRDTAVSNEKLQRRILELHREEEVAREELRAAHIDLDEAKKRQTLQRYYRARAEEEQKDKHATLAALVAAQSNRNPPASKSRVVDLAPKAPPLEQFTPSNLNELRVIVADTVDRAQGFRAKRDKLAAALRDVVALRVKLEGSLNRELRHTESLAGSLTATKDQIRLSTASSAQELKSARMLERQVADLSNQCSKLERLLEEADKHRERLAKRLRASDGHVGCLQSARAESRQNVEAEAAGAHQRDAAIAALREENAQLIQWLLDDTPNFLSDEEMACITQRAAAKAATTMEYVDNLPRTTQPILRPTKDPREERLFRELEEALQSAMSSVRPSNRR